MLTDRDFAAIRQSVIATIERRRARRTFAIRAAGLALSLIVVFVVAMRTTTEDNVIVAPVRRATLHKPAEITVAPRAVAPIKVATRRVHKRHHEQEQRSPIRLELATADPDVRIIWISTGETR